MNLFDSSFLCLDIGTSGVRGIAHRVRSGRISNSALHTVESFDTVFAIKSVIDELEKQIGTSFDSAYLTGNFGESEFSTIFKNTQWPGEHKITAADIMGQINRIQSPEDFYPMHMIPLRYDTSSARNLLSPIGHTDKLLVSVFSSIFYTHQRTSDIISWLRRAHIQVESCFDPSFLLNENFHKKNETVLFIDLGAEFTSASVWTPRGPVFLEKIQIGQKDITNEIIKQLKIGFSDAEKIKCLVASISHNEMDRFTPADSSYGFSRSDINDIILPVLLNIMEGLKKSISASIAKYSPSGIFLSGGGSNINGIEEFIENTFGISVTNISTDAAVKSLSSYVWNSQSSRIRSYFSRRAKIEAFFNKATRFLRRKRKPKKRYIPIMPSTLAFDMTSPATYNLFKSGGIDTIHVDIMDGFFVDNIISNIKELKSIRKMTDSHLYVHLMTESPVIWATDAANAGADTIIISANTAGVRAALVKIKEMGKRCGVALNPETPASILKPVLKELDEILIMSVAPGTGGQEFQESVLNKISVLANTRKRYNLGYKISVDGGINAQTAKKCWQHGADKLASGSYLAKSNDFPLAVLSLLNKD